MFRMIEEETRSDWAGTARRFVRQLAVVAAAVALFGSLYLVVLIDG